NNLTTVQHWDRFASHRTRVTALTLACGGETVALLGAGNCNDVNLPVLAEQFRSIHLVDIDRDAVQRARARQPFEVLRSLSLHAPVDLSGCLGQLARYRTREPSPLELGGWSAKATARVLQSVPM